MKKIDIAGRKVGLLLIVKESDSVNYPCGLKERKYICRCECGNQVQVTAGSLLKGRSKSCGCLRRKPRKYGLDNPIGARLGQLTIIKDAPSHKQPNGRIVRQVECLCDCGQTKVCRLIDLRRGKIQSCGCYRPAYKHGHAFGTKSNPETRTYRSWSSMIQRCMYSKSISYKNYGGRGITVSERWQGEHGFENFLEDMGERPAGMTLDRYPNNDGNYEPGNCRWATPSQQNRNRRPRKQMKEIRASAE